MQLPHYDLHCHSSASDGALAPEVLLQRAIDRRIKILALTDHDTVKGVQQLVDLPQSDVTLIPGAEFTGLWGKRILHIVGLGLNLSSPALNTYFAGLNKLRIERAEKMALQLQKMGLPDLYEKASILASGGTIGRPHFAKAMVAEGVVANEQQAFKKYIGTGQKGDIKVAWPTLETVVKTINDAEGVAILAHPTKYKMTFTKLRSAIDDFISVGGQGIEVSYPGVSNEHQRHLLRIAESKGLLISAGSDFHSPAYGWTDLGKFPQLPAVENHVLSQVFQDQATNLVVK